MSVEWVMRYGVGEDVVEGVGEVRSGDSKLRVRVEKTHVRM